MHRLTAKIFKILKRGDCVEVETSLETEDIVSCRPAANAYDWHPFPEENTIRTIIDPDDIEDLSISDVDNRLSEEILHVEEINREARELEKEMKRKSKAAEHLPPRDRMNNE